MQTDIVLNPIDISAPVIVEAARRAESAGFQAVWTYDHISAVAFRGSTTLGVWAVLSAVASATERVHLGPLVINTVARHPAHIAVASATLQELSGGRFEL